MKNPPFKRWAALAGVVFLLVASASHGAGRKASSRASNAAAGDTWSYAGKTGPEKWSGLSAENEQCKEGQFQSPIDIPDATTRKGDFPSILFNYKPSPLKIIDDGHTVQVNYAPGSSFTIDDKRYDLVQFHFHKPSEEKIDGKGHEMSVHLVHRGPDGKPAYMAVLLDSGKENRVVKALMSNLPKEKDKEVTVEQVTINAVNLLPNSKDYYRYVGSLTTPPCTGDVTWFVMKRPVSISADSVARFSRVHSMNARPVQPVNGRDIEATR